MQLTFLEHNTIKLKTLPNKYSGKYTITNQQDEGKETVLLTIEAEQSIGEQYWIVKSSKVARICNSQGEPCKIVRIEPGNIYHVRMINNERALLMVDHLSDQNVVFTKYQITSYGQITIGKSIENDIVFENDFVSRNHAVINVDRNGISIQDDHSSNGTYVDGVKINHSHLHPGSVIYIIGLKIIVGNGFFAINNPNSKVIVGKKLAQYNQPLLSLDSEEEIELEKEFFSRAPRFRKVIRPHEFKVDPPPQVQNPPGTPLMFMLGPSITMGMSSLMMGYFTVTNTLARGGELRTAMPTLSMSICMMIGMVLWPILTKRYEKKQKDEKEALRQEKYKKYLSDVLQDIKKVAEKQKKLLLNNYITVDECVKRIKKKDMTLWDRQFQHGDFLETRLGIGTIPMFAEFKFPEWRFTLDDDNLQNILQDVANRPKNLEEVPVTLSFMKEYVSGIIGERKQVIEYIQGLLFQLVSLHSYDELKLVFIFDENEVSDWDFAKWLPHVFNDNRNIRFYANNSTDVKELSTYLENIFNHRSELSEEKMLDEHEHYLIVSASKKLASKAEITKLLLNKAKKNEDYIGFSMISLYDEVKNLPKECTCVIELERNTGKIYSNFNVSEGYIKFNLDNYQINQPEMLSKELLNTTLDITSGHFQLPEMYTFLEMYKAGKIEHLNIISKWDENNPVLSLKAPIGVDAYGDVFCLDLHEKFHGPHGLVAGMTGSGKSEFIMTYILSMAVNYHPHEVAFILIDFKGGGMADTFDNLPHVAGKITNLDGSLMNRSLVSIESELKRRQRIFSETSSKTDISNIDIYKYQQLFREGKVSEPIQHLIIISDEFAELKSQQPEFMDKLISAARIGRSLGVHLILATQKPSGVVNEQIWANSKFRVCLKVQEKADSMEMIKRPEAANIAETGRYYIQVGYNELFEMGQSAWSGAPYYPAERFEENKEEYMTVIDHLGRELRRGELSRKDKAIKNPAKQIDQITKYINQLAKEDGIAVRKLWLEPISPLIYMDDIIRDYNYHYENNEKLNPVIGLLDDPEQQEQRIMTLPISEKGNTIVYGVTDSGKTTFVTAVIYSVINQNRPTDVHLYIMDFGSQTLKAFEKAPHVGDVIFSDEEEKVANLFTKLNREMTTRRRILADYGGDINKYRKITGKTLESILVVINNFGSFSEIYNDYLDDIRDLTGNGLKYGLYFIVTANSTSNIRYRVVQNFNQLFALNFNDDSEYSSVVGHSDGLRPGKFKGRGLVKFDKVYEYQIARVTDDLDNTFEFIQNMCLVKRDEYAGYKAPRIPVLPKELDASYFAGLLDQMVEGTYPVGIDKTNLEHIDYDIYSSCVHMVSFSDHEPTKFMEGLCDVIGLQNHVQLKIIDVAAEMDKKYKADTDANRVVDQLFDLLVHRNNNYKDAIEEGREVPIFEPIICVINGFSPLVKPLNAERIENMKLLLQKNELAYKVYFVIAEEARRISLIKNDSWYRKHCDHGISFWLGDGIMQNTSVLKMSKFSNDLYAEIGSDYSYFIYKNKTRLMKHIQSQGII